MIKAKGPISETHLLVAAQIFPTAQIFLELNFILGIQDEKLTAAKKDCQTTANFTVFWQFILYSKK